MAAPVVARDFFDLVKAIGESKSKQEEDRIISDEVVYLKKTIPQSSANKKKLKELIIRSIYVEMLGQDASFSYIRAVELCASTNIIQKRAGYLAASLFLAPTHEFRFMLVNQIQRDMNSSNHLDACTALVGVSKLITEDMIPAVIGDVVKLFRHDMESVRKKAVSALHRLYQLDKNCVVDHIEKIRRSLCDKDPCVMGATLPLLQDLVQDDPNSYKDLVPSLVSILKQITDHRLPRDFDYHRMPAPWIQMNILRILAFLGCNDQSSSEGMYEVLLDVMKRADIGINVGYALVYEAVKTVTTIYPNTTLLDTAATAISRFIRSDSHNLKYIGIKGLASIVRGHPKYAADHQLAVIDCLEDPDETLKRKTLDLLFRMTNSVNVEFIVEKLLSFLSTALDDHFRSDLVSQITQCAERYAPSNAWYVNTIVRVFELAGDKVNPSVASTLTQLIAEGMEDDEEDEENDGEVDDTLRMEIVEDFLDLIEKPRLPELLSQTIAWVVGEYGYLSEAFTKVEIMNRLCDLADQSLDPTTRCHIVTALMKLVAQEGTCPSRVLKFISLYQHSWHIDFQHRCHEFKTLLKHTDILVDLLPVDASCEDLEFDGSLSFLNGFVNEARAAGAPSYSPPSDMYEDTSANKTSLKVTPYEKPVAPPPSSGILPGLSSLTMNASSGSSSSSSSGSNVLPIPIQGPTPLGPALTNPAPVMSGPAAQGNQLLAAARGGAGVWGRKPAVEPPPPPTPAPAPAPTPAPAPSFTSSSSSTPASPAVPSSSIFPNASSSLPSSPEVTAPRPMTEKEKMAQALFGGITSTSSSTSKLSGKSRRASTSTTTTTASNISTTATSSSPSPSVAHSMQPISTSPAVVDLLDLDSTPSHSASPLPPVPMATTATKDLFDLGNLQSLPSSPPPIPPSPPSASPLRLTTAEFGQRWGQNPMEVKQQVSTPRVHSLEDLRRVMPPQYAHIESIVASSEAIFASSVVINGNTLTILIHCKVHGMRGMCDVTVKSINRDVCGREFSVISLALGA